MRRRPLIEDLAITARRILAGAGRRATALVLVTIVALGLAWPLMVLPTWAAWYYEWGLYWAWGFASAYIISLALTFLLRFRAEKWKSMRVIEQAPPLDEIAA